MLSKVGGIKADFGGKTLPFFNYYDIAVNSKRTIAAYIIILLK